MKMNVAHFKKIHEDEKTATLKHADGHEIRIAKNGITRKMQKDLKDIPMYAEGGEVEDGDRSPASEPYKTKGSHAPKYTPEQTNAMLEKETADGLAMEAQDELAKNSSVSQSRNLAKQYPQAAPEDRSWQDTLKDVVKSAPSKIAEVLMPFTNPGFDIPGTSQSSEARGEYASNEALGKNLKTAGVEQAPQSGIAMSAPAIPQTAQQQAPSALSQVTGATPIDQSPDIFGAKKGQSELDRITQEQEQVTNALAEQQKDHFNRQLQQSLDQQKIQEDQQALVQKNLKDFNDTQAPIVAAYQNKQIDPNRVFHNMSTGSKILNAIGLLLGGVGAGLTGGDNPALKYINDQVNKDIEAQKADIGKYPTLLDFYQKKYGHTVQATTMAADTQKNIIALQAVQEAARTGDAEAMNRAKALQLQFQNEQLMHQTDFASKLARTQMAAQLQGGTVPNSANGINEEKAAINKIRAGMLSGTISNEQANEATKEYAAAQQMTRHLDNAMRQFDTVANTTKLAYKTNPMNIGKMYTGTEAAQLNDTFLKLARDSAGRFNEAELPLMREKYDPRFGDDDQQIAIKKQALMNHILESMNFPHLAMVGVKPPSSQTTFKEKPIALGRVKK